MKQTIGFSRLGGLALAMTTAGVGLWACSGEFKTACPEGTTQTAGGGDVDQACTRDDQLAGQGGASGRSGGAPPIPPGGECAPTQTRCSEGKQQLCSDGGAWGAPTECDLACDQQNVTSRV